MADTGYSIASAGRACVVIVWGGKNRPPRLRSGAGYFLRGVEGARTTGDPSTCKEYDGQALSAMAFDQGVYSPAVAVSQKGNGNGVS